VKETPYISAYQGLFVRGSGDPEAETKDPSASVRKDLSETLKFEKREEQSLLWSSDGQNVRRRLFSE
jgi:hypothetical protein